jgi:hypothetical protein
LWKIDLAMPSLTLSTERTLKNSVSRWMEEAEFVLETHCDYAAAVEFHQVLDCNADHRETDYAIAFETVACCKMIETRPTFLAMQLQMEELLQRAGTHSELLVPENTLVDVKNITGDKFVSIVGEPLTGNPRNALSTLLPLSLLGSCTEAEIPGVGKLKRVGDSWTANSECFLKGMEIFLMGLANVNATAKLEGLEMGNGVPCFRLGLSVGLVGFRKEARPRGSGEFRGQVVSIDTTAQIGSPKPTPVDSSLPDIAEDFTRDMK